MDERDIARWRLRTLRLEGTGLETSEEVVRWLGAVQSQDYGPAKWSLGERNAAATTDADVDRLYTDGRILRTHVLRPTWHFVLPEDIRWLLAVTAPRVHALNAYYYRQNGLDDEALRERCEAVIVTALAGGNQLTRRQLDAALQGAGIDTSGLRLGYILMRAELDGIVCSGRPAGKQHTYALLDERAPAARRLSDDEALAELTLRYFTSHGPATAKDFRWWSSLKAADINRGLDMVAPRLNRERYGDLEYWFAEPPPDLEETATPEPAVHLLQAYDEYIVGYSESKYVLDVSGTARAMTDRPVFNNVVILDSQVAGFWKRTLNRDSVSIEAALDRPFDGAQAQALQAAADRHGKFLGLPATVTTREL